MLKRIFLDRKLLKGMDFGLLIAVIIMMIFSIMNVYSATNVNFGLYYGKLQFVWLIIGLIIVYIILLFDYTMLYDYAYVFYALSILLLVLNKAIGATRNGATGWIAIGPFTIQPSEFAKVAIIIILAKKIEDFEGEINKLKNFLLLIILAIIPTALVYIQPDMGMTMVIFFACFGIVFLAGLDIRIVIGGIVTLVTGILIAFNVPGIIQDYQKERILELFSASTDLQGNGYQLWQAQVGIGSGGVLGKGFLNGTQIRGGFVPEAFTDFISAVVGEEWGLIGYAFILILYGIILFRSLRIANNSKDIFGKLIVAGFLSVWTFLVLQNLGMCVGIMPITGVALPFMSYGGSSTMTNFIALGIILNVGMRSKKLNF